MTHFKNVIHARETRLGCGIAIKPGDGAYVVAHYSMGPMIQFRLNDFSPLKDIGPRKEPGKIIKKETKSLSYLLLRMAVMLLKRNLNPYN